MRSVRFDRLLASTALVVLLAGAAGALAQTAETPPDKAPAVSDTAPADGKRSRAGPRGAGRADWRGGISSR